MILAGGASRRFGSPKGLARLNGERLIDIVRARLRQQISGPIAVSTAQTGSFADLGYALVPDRHIGQPGPLAGLYAAMHWAGTRGYGNVVTVPVDVPFLPLDLITKLRSVSSPAIAASGDRAHPVCGVWPIAVKDDLNAQIGGGMRAAHAWADHCKATAVHFADNSAGRDPFFNINTPEDLAKAQSF